MGMPFVEVTSGGLAVTEAANKLGVPIDIATNGKGVAVRFIDKGGLPVVLGSGGRQVAWRADGMNADASNIIPATGAAQFSTTGRERHYSQTATDTFRVLIPLWVFPNSGSMTETDLPEAYDFAVAGEFPFFAGRTSIPTNTRVRGTILGVGGSTYSYTFGQSATYAIFEVKFPSVVPKNTAFGLWVTHECVAGRSGAVTNKQICKAQIGSNSIERFQGFIAVSNPATGHIASDAAMTLTTVNQSTTLITGTNVPMGAGAIIVPMPSSRKSLLVNGNSIEAGNQEGYGQSSGFGDATGDTYGNRGYGTRLAQRLGVAVAQMSKGSDRDSYRLTALNYMRRMAMMAVINPTHVLDMNPHNEIASGITRATAWGATTGYAVDAVAANGGNMYICDGAGTSASSGGPSGTGTGIADGSVQWTYIGPDDMGTPGRDGGGWVGDRRKRLRLDRAAIPSAKFIGSAGTPDADCVQNSTTYNYTGTTLTITLADVSSYFVGLSARVQGLTPAGLNSPSNGFSTVAAVDAGLKTVSFTVASGLGAASGTANVRSEWAGLADQVPTTGYGASSSVRSWVNRFLRTLPNNSQVLNYTGIVDLGKYSESGAPVTAGTETGKWRILLDGTPLPIGGGMTYDKTHPTSQGYDKIASDLAADSTVTSLFA